MTTSTTNATPTIKSKLSRNQSMKQFNNSNNQSIVNLNHKPITKCITSTATTNDTPVSNASNTPRLVTPSKIKQRSTKSIDSINQSIGTFTRPNTAVHKQNIKLNVNNSKPDTVEKKTSAPLIPIELIQQLIDTSLQRYTVQCADAMAALRSEFTQHHTNTTTQFNQQASNILAIQHAIEYMTAQYTQIKQSVAQNTNDIQNYFTNTDQHIQSLSDGSIQQHQAIQASIQSNKTEILTLFNQSQKQQELLDTLQQSHLLFNKQYNAINQQLRSNMDTAQLQYKQLENKLNQQLQHITVSSRMSPSVDPATMHHISNAVPPDCTGDQLTISVPCIPYDEQPIRPNTAKSNELLAAELARSVPLVGLHNEYKSMESTKSMLPPATPLNRTKSVDCKLHDVLPATPTREYIDALTLRQQGIVSTPIKKQSQSGIAFSVNLDTTNTNKTPSSSRRTTIAASQKK